MTFRSIATERRRSKQSGKPYNPWPYQKRAIRFLLEHAFAALFLDPGLGKTSIVYAAFLYLLKKGLAKGMLVVAPLRPCQLVWPKERDKWLDFQGLDVAVLHGKDKEKLAAEQHDVYVVNYEGLDWLVKSGTLQRMLRRKAVDVLAWDELTKMKNPDSKRFKTMKPLLPRFGRRWGLTGSAGSNGLLQLFGQCYVLDMGKAFGQYVTHFRAQFFQPTGMYGWKPAANAEQLIYERLKPLALRMDAEELIQMPRQMPIKTQYELPAEARKHYDELEADLFTVIGSSKINAVNCGVATGRLRQLCSGAIYTQEYCEITGAPMRSRNKNREFVEVHDAKMEAFAELVDELNGQQVFVGYEFQHDLARIQEWFGEVPYIGGGTSDKRAKEYEEAWNSGDLPWLFGHPASIGHGLNMQDSHAKNVIFFTVPWDFELYDQFIRRLRRQGNESKYVNVYHLVGKDTVEEDVMMSLVNKERTQRQLYEAIKNRRARKVDYDPEANALRVRMMELANRKKLAQSRKRA
jgi:SNF2 family DNA or RNA helicase